MASKSFQIVFVFILAAELQTASCQEGMTSQGNNSSLPVTYTATILEGGDQVCPPEEQLEMARAEIGEDILSTIRNVIILCPGQVQENPASSCLEISQCNPRLPSQNYWITSSSGTAIQVYCDMTRSCSCSSTSIGGWSRVAYLNMTDPTQQCPPAWREITGPVRACGRTNETSTSPATSRMGGCSSASFSTYNISFSHICGRIIGYQFGSPDAFAAYTRSFYTRIEDPYFDGVVITRGTEKEHVWTFSGSVSESTTDDFLDDVCPCTNARSTQSEPPFVGTDYFCETAVSGDFDTVLYPDDPLWDGENCSSGSTCCEFNDPPYFCKTLSQPTTDEIEVRICADELLENEDTPIELIEIFVQ